jgi:hypothetical protein
MRSFPHPFAHDDSANLSPANVGEVQQVFAVLMDRDEAERCVHRIRDGMDSIRADVLRLHEGEGWKALGYGSWRECVVAEFGQSQRHLYQLLTAAKIERELLLAGEDDFRAMAQTPIPERQLRELARLPDAESRREVWQQVVQEHGIDLTAAKVEEAVRRRWEASLTPEQVEQADVAAYAMEMRDAVAGRLTPKTTAEWENTPISVLGDAMPPPYYIPPAEEFMHKLTGVAIRALSTSIDDAVEGIGDGQLSDTDLLPKFRLWLSDLANALSNDKKIRRLP